MQYEEERREVKKVETSDCVWDVTGRTITEARGGNVEPRGLFFFFF